MSDETVFFKILGKEQIKARESAHTSHHNINALLHHKQQLKCPILASRSKQNNVDILFMYFMIRFVVLLSKSLCSSIDQDISVICYASVKRIANSVKNYSIYTILLHYFVKK